jgi:endoglucanase
VGASSSAANTANGTGGGTTNAGATLEAVTSATTAGASSSPIDRYGQLQVVAGRLSDANGLPVTLRGQGFGWDNWWPQYYNADAVGWLRDDWCVDVVRPAMGIEPEGAYLANPAASKARVQAVVEAAIAKEIYVIIDWHAHDRHESEAAAFFSEMAQAYGAQPNVIYEIFNEPDDETWPDVKAYAETVIAAIRQHDPDNIVIVGSPEWDQRIDTVAADPITSDQNVVYSLHFYAATHGQWLRDRATLALAAGIPLFVSESSGSDAAGQGVNDYTQWQAWFDLMEQQQISWVHYSVSDKAGETISVLEPGAAAQGSWGATQLTETGEYIRDRLRSRCN